METSEFLKRIDSDDGVVITWSDEERFNVAVKDEDGTWWGLLSVRYYYLEGVMSSIRNQLEWDSPIRLIPKFGINGFEEA